MPAAAKLTGSPINIMIAPPMEPLGDQPARPGESLLHTKLTPPRLHSSSLPRPQLSARLDGVLQKKLALLTAPTGYGKTTAVRMWLAERGHACAWVSLDENDNDPVRFWSYVITALRTLEPSIGKSGLASLVTSQISSFQAILIPLINELAQLPQPGILVLQDYHAIHSSAIHETVSFLLQHLPESLHVILISRNEPDLPLGILRARDELLELDAAGLRFSRAETESFLQATVQADISAPALDKLQAQTEGWPAGLRLASLALQRPGSMEAAEGKAVSFSGSHRYVVDYLVREVFEAQPKEMQDFLLQTCFLRRLSGALCDAVTGSQDGESALQKLEAQGLFVTQLEVAGGRAWYRYNPLFAEAIQALARQRLGEEAAGAVMERASRWYADRRLYDEAIELALQAKLYERVIELIERFIEIHDITEFQTLNRWLKAMPEQLILLHPSICFAYAQVILYTTDRFAAATPLRIERFLGAAEHAWREQSNEAALGQVLSFRGMMAWWQGDSKAAFEYAYGSLQQLAEEDVLYRGTSLLILASQALNDGRIVEAQDIILEARAVLGAAQNLYGVLAAKQLLSEVFFWQGDSEQAKQLSQEILEQAVGDESMLDDQGIALLMLARLAYEEDDLEHAGQFAGRALQLARARGNEMLEVQASICSAYTQTAAGDVDQARQALKSLTARIQNTAVLREVEDAQAQLVSRAAEGESLDWWLKTLEEPSGRTRVQEERAAFMLARLQIAHGSVEDALGVLQKWRSDASQHGRLRSQVGALCLEALAHQANSDQNRAHGTFVRALMLGNGKKLRRLFLDEGKPMLSLLQVVLPALSNAGLRLYATVLLHSFSPGLLPGRASPDSALLLEPISQQELRVLRLLVAGLSNPEIARELVISPNTVKTHIKSLYRKLGVRSRAEARQAARELNLL